MSTERRPPEHELWSAIGEPSRRQLLDVLLARGEASASALAADVPFTRQAVAKHLAVLDRVGLVTVRPVGRERHYRIDDAQLARAVAQLSAVGAEWDRRLQRIKRIAESIQRSKQS